MGPSPATFSPRSRRDRAPATWIGLLALLAGAAGPPGARAADVVVVRSGENAPYLLAEAAVRTKLEERGHTPVSVDLAELESGRAHVDAAAALVAVGTGAARWVRDHRAPGAPASYCLVSDPGGLEFGVGAADGLSGVPMDVPVETQLALVGELLPGDVRLGMIYREDSPRSVWLRDRVREQLPPGWTLAAVAADRQDRFADTLRELWARGPDLVWTAPDAAIWGTAEVRSVLLEGLRRGVPVFGFSLPFVQAGAVIGVGVDPTRQGERAAELLQESMDGAPARRVEPEFELAVNLVVAEELRLAVPRSLVDRAPHVVGGAPR